MPRQSKREQVVDSAITLFKHNGINTTGIDSIVDKAQVSKKTLYNHFKTKDDLILAALRKDDEIGRNALMQFVDRCKSDSIGKILSIFDFYEMWFNSEHFKGCFFINSAAEIAQMNESQKNVCAEHKVLIASFIEKLAIQAGASEPASLAKALNILLEGATVYAYVVKDKHAIKQAKIMAQTLISTSVSRAA